MDKSTIIGTIIGSLMTVIVGVLGFWGSIYLDDRRSKKQRLEDLSYQIYTDVTNPINAAMACIVEFMHRTLPLVNKQSECIALDPAIITSLSQYLHTLLNGIQKHTDLNHIDKQVFVSLATRLKPAIRAIDDFIDDNDGAITKSVVEAIIAKTNPILVEAKACVDMCMPDWHNII